MTKIAITQKEPIFQHGKGGDGQVDARVLSEVYKLPVEWPPKPGGKQER